MVRHTRETEEESLRRRNQDVEYVRKRLFRTLMRPQRSQRTRAGVLLSQVETAARRRVVCTMAALFF